MSAVVYAAAGEKRIGPVLTSLFLQAGRRASMAQLAHGLRQLKVDILDKIYPTKTFEDTARLPERMRALLTARHPQAAGLLGRILAAKTTTHDLRAQLLRAYRSNQLPSIQPAWSRFAPKGVRDLLD